MASPNSTTLSRVTGNYLQMTSASAPSGFSVTGSQSGYEGPSGNAYQIFDTNSDTG